MSELDGVHVVRAQKQHSSVVVVIPKNIRIALGLKVRDLVVFDLHRGNPPQVYLSKFKGDKNHAKAKANSDRKGAGRRPRAQDGRRR